MHRLSTPFLFTQNPLFVSLHIAIGYLEAWGSQIDVSFASWARRHQVPSAAHMVMDIFMVMQTLA